MQITESSSHVHPKLRWITRGPLSPGVRSSLVAPLSSCFIYSDSVGWFVTALLSFLLLKLPNCLVDDVSFACLKRSSSFSAKSQWILIVLLWLCLCYRWGFPADTNVHIQNAANIWGMCLSVFNFYNCFHVVYLLIELKTTPLSGISAWIVLG